MSPRLFPGPQPAAHDRGRFGAGRMRICGRRFVAAAGSAGQDAALGGDNPATKPAGALFEQCYQAADGRGETFHLLFLRILPLLRHDSKPGAQRINVVLRLLEAIAGQLAALLDGGDEASSHAAA